MNASRAVLIAAVVANLLGWVLPAVQDFRGWSAFGVALSPLWSAEDFQDEPVWLLILIVGSALTNVLFVGLAGAVLARRPAQGRALGRGGGDLARPALGDHDGVRPPLSRARLLHLGLLVRAARVGGVSRPSASPLGQIAGRYGTATSAPARTAVDALGDFVVISLPYHHREVRSMAAPQLKHTVERERQALNGWLALLLVVLWFVAAIAFFVSTAWRPTHGALSERATAFRVFGAAPDGWARHLPRASASSRSSRTRRAC